MPVIDTNTTPVEFDIVTGTLHIGDQEIQGFADAHRVDATYNITNILQNRVDWIEPKLYSLEEKLDGFFRSFTADFVRELIRRCEEFVNNRELTGMTDEEFEAEIENLLFSGGV